MSAGSHIPRPRSRRSWFVVAGGALYLAGWAISLSVDSSHTLISIPIAIAESPQASGLPMEALNAEERERELIEQLVDVEEIVTSTLDGKTVFNIQVANCEVSSSCPADFANRLSSEHAALIAEAQGDTDSLDTEIALAQQRQTEITEEMGATAELTPAEFTAQLVQADVRIPTITWDASLAQVSGYQQILAEQRLIEDLERQRDQLLRRKNCSKKWSGHRLQHGVSAGRRVTALPMGLSAAGALLALGALAWPTRRRPKTTSTTSTSDQEASADIVNVPLATSGPIPGAAESTWRRPVRIAARLALLGAAIAVGLCVWVAVQLQQRSDTETARLHGADDRLAEFDYDTAEARITELERSTGDMEGLASHPATRILTLLPGGHPARTQWIDFATLFGDNLAVGREFLASAKEIESTEQSVGELVRSLEGGCRRRPTH